MISIFTYVLTIKKRRFVMKYVYKLINGYSNYRRSFGLYVFYVNLALYIIFLTLFTIYVTELTYTAPNNTFANAFGGSKSTTPASTESTFQEPTLTSNLSTLSPNETLPTTKAVRELYMLRLYYSSKILSFTFRIKLKLVFLTPVFRIVMIIISSDSDKYYISIFNLTYTSST